MNAQANVAAALTEDAIASDATAALLLKRGEAVWTYHGPGSEPDALLHTGSVTKFVLGLCVAHAVFAGTIDSVDEPASQWLTEWGNDDRSAITLRHLMTHTSGLALERLPDNPDPPVTTTALALEQIARPGETMAYNNHGAQAVAEILRRATGHPVDEYAAARLFAPLGIDSWAWNHGTDGLPFGMSSLQLAPRDLARIGELSLAGGTWDGTRLFAADWAVADRRPGGGFGLLEMLVPEADVVVDLNGSHDLDPRVSEIANRLDGSTIPLNGARSLYAALGRAVGPAGVREAFAGLRRCAPNLRFARPVLQAYGHTGSGGQYLWIAPAADGVAVRMRAFDDRSDTPAVETAFTELALDALID